MFTELLERTRRYSVETQTDPMLALATANDFRPDVLIVDVRMPGLDGLELAKTIRAQEVLQDRPIIFYSGFLDPATIENLKTIGGPVEFWPKSETGKALVAAIDRVCAAFGSAVGAKDAQPPLGA